MRLKGMAMRSEREPAAAPIAIVTPEERARIKEEFGLSGTAAAMVDQATGSK
jgi:hypothetical protein